jgi:uncharacterized protein
MTKPRIQILNRDLTIHRLNPDDEIPIELSGEKYFWIGKTNEELSIVCESGIKLPSQKSDDGWAAIKLVGPLDLSAVGILAGITKILSEEGINVFAISTFDTDYILVKRSKIDSAVKVLQENGYVLEQPAE